MVLTVPSISLNVPDARPKARVAISVGLALTFCESTSADPRVCPEPQSGEHKIVSFYQCVQALRTIRYSLCVPDEL